MQKGLIADWFYSLEPGSITNFASLKERFLKCFAGPLHIKQTPMELFDMRRREKESLHHWYVCFVKVEAEVDNLMPKEKMAVFQRCLHDDEFVKNLIVDPLSDVTNLAV